LIKSLLIGFLYYCVLLINACCNCPVSNKKYEVGSLWLQNEKYVIKGDSSFSVDLDSRDTIRAGEYGLAVFFDLKYTTFQQPWDNIKLINSAYACKCKEGYAAKDSLSKIQIITLNDFDEEHLRYSDVSNYFYKIEVIGNKVVYNSISDNFSQYDYLYDLREPLIIRSYLRSHPQLNKELRFDVRVTFKNGKTLHYFTKPIYVL
jgi:hypothetical protein